MFLRNPSWWKKASPPFWTRALSKMYCFCAEHFNRAKPIACAPCRVISIGSLFMGGSGKTPVAIALAHSLSALYDPVFMTRGYKGRHKGPLWVNPDIHSPHDVGEEALLLAQHFPTIVSRKRAEGLSLMSFTPKTLLILDDAHQHTSLKKDLSLLVVTQEQSLSENMWVFPAGPLRESIKGGVSRADALLRIVSPFSSSQSFENWDLETFILQATFHTSLSRDQRVIGFGALGNPERFFLTLKSLFSDVVDFKVFPDHFFYTPKEEKNLLQESARKNALLVTTAKDWIKLSKAFQPYVHVVTQKLCLGEDFLQWLESCRLNIHGAQ